MMTCATAKSPYQDLIGLLPFLIAASTAAVCRPHCSCLMFRFEEACVCTTLSGIWKGVKDHRRRRCAGEGDVQRR